MLRRIAPFVSPLLILIVILTACIADARGRKPSADWSRNLVVGEAAVGSIGLAMEGAGERVHLAWPAGRDDGLVLLRYAQLDSTATLVVERELAIAPGRLRAPRLLAAGDDRLHLLYAAREEGVGWALWHVLLNDDGTLAGNPTPLSPAENDVGHYAVTSNRPDQGTVVWASNDGIYAQSLSTQGTDGLESVQISSSGASPDAFLDESGRLHVAWFDEGRIFYSTVAVGEPGEAMQSHRPAPTAVADVPLGTGATLDGPVVGVAGGQVTLLWSVLNQSGLQAGTAQTSYVSFPVGAPTLAPPRAILISPEEEQPYTLYQGPYSLTQLAAPAVPGSQTDFVMQPAAAGGRGETLAVAVSATQAFRLDAYSQIAVAVLENGALTGYAFASKTEGFSQEPALAADTGGHLHLAWREGAGGAKIAYATTAPAARARLDRLSLDDLLNVLLAGGTEGLVGILFFPLALGWLLPGLLVVGLWKLIRDDENVNSVASILLLVVALAFYQLTKLAFLPRMQTYVPFSAWIDIPAGWSLPLRVGVPAVTFLMGLLAAERVRRRRPASSLVYYLILAGVDAILTLAIYGVNFLGVF